MVDSLSWFAAAVMSTAVVAGIAIVLRLLKRSSARLRCDLLTLTIVVLLLSGAVPKLYKFQLPISRPRLAIAKVETQSESRPSESPSSELFASQLAEVPPESDASSVVEVPPPSDAVSVAKISADVTAFPPRWLVVLESLAVTIWLTGIGVSLVLFTARLRKFIWPTLVRDGQASQLIASRLSQSRYAELAKVAPTITVSSAVGTPCVMGLPRGRIVLPLHATKWSMSTLETAVFHELQHLRRWDLLRSLLACVAIAVHWYNPLVWWLSKRLYAEREFACDEIVVGGMGEGPIVYFEQVLQTIGDRSLPAVIPEMGAREQLVQRIDWLTETRPSVGRLRTAAAIALTLGALSLMPWIGWKLQPVQLVVYAQSDEGIATTAVATVTTGD